MKNKIFKSSYVWYTIAFLLITPLVFYSFIQQNRSFVWKLDGLAQHYQALLYFGKYLRDLVFHGQFKMIDFSIGMGYDVLTTLNYYVIGDPLTLLSIFMTKKNGVYFYDFFIILRFYLAGISFCYFADHFMEKKKTEAVVLGGLIYVFCGYAMFAGIRHPFFMNPMIYMPLLFWGIEKVLKKQKPYLLIGITFISALSNFYFFYMLSILVILYAIIRYFAVYAKEEKNVWIGLIRTGLSTAGYYLLGIGLSSVILIPVIYAFTQNARLNIVPKLVSNSIYHYNLKYYQNLVQGWFVPNTSLGYWTELSFAGITLISVAIMFANRKFFKLRMLYIFAFLGLSVPIVGIVMNGMSYDANRWSFILSFITAMIFVETYEKLFALKLKDKIVSLGMILVYGILSEYTYVTKTMHTMFSVFILFWILLFVLQLNIFQKRKIFAHICVWGIVFISVVMNGIGIYSSNGENYASEFLSKSEVDNKISDQDMQLIDTLKQKDKFYRIDTGNELTLNHALSNTYNGISSYYSLMSKNVSNFMSDMENTSQVSLYRFQNLDSRSILEDLCSVKYYITKTKAQAPYGFKKMDNKSNANISVYENKYQIPLGSMFYQYVLEKNYKKLSALQKQSLLLNNLILPAKAKNAQENIQNQDSAVATAGLTKIPFEIEQDPTEIQQVEQQLHVSRDSFLILKFNKVLNAEMYVSFRGLGILGNTNTSMAQFYVYANTNKIEPVNVKSPYYNSYFGKKNYLVNLGYKKSGIKKAIIYFPSKMSYSLDSIHVYAQNMASVKNEVAIKKTDSLKNMKIQTNQIMGNITAQKNGMLFLSIPYSKGWTAYVDGKRTKIDKADTMFMAVSMEKGTHQIKLVYQTPYLKTGMIVSIFCILILAGIIYKQENRKRNHTQES